ncbi:hypothetical protein [Pseudocnuella soli]|uniref:hypothetical protein n=1 Tax=Pseudocnuella soli TaxID=2502779 RepID=UPI001043336D|nr:hypothetical protein [Pseudocnuella soli]
MNKRIEITLIKPFLYSLIITFLTSCGDSASTTEKFRQEQILTDQQTTNAEVYKPEIELKNFTKEDVARFAISSIMGQPPKEVKVQHENGLYYVSYKRKSDKQKFSYKIKIDGRTIVWANIDGRWRDGRDDERISFEETDNTLKITQGYSDGSGETKEFKKGE